MPDDVTAAAPSDRAQPAGGGVRRLILLGATGSIGRSTLDVLRSFSATGGPRFELVAACAGRDVEGLSRIAAEFGLRELAVSAPPEGFVPPSGATWRAGPDAATELVEAVVRPGDLVVSAIVGVAGLRPTLAAIERGADIALANKETLVAGGDVVMPAVAEAGVRMLPVDSEHAAIAQCLAATSGPDDVEEIVLTASGGPFRTWSQDRIDAARVEDALSHPTWDMGAKVTVDSASLMNKALEVVEAHHLFGVPESRLGILVHPQSIVHGLIRLRDGSVLAALAAPDMRTPIQQALSWPEVADAAGARLEWDRLAGLEFAAPDLDRFPAPELARRVIRIGGTSGAILNAANEVAVEAFLRGRLPFPAVVRTAAAVLDEMPAVPVNGLDDVLGADAEARSRAARRIDS